MCASLCAGGERQLRQLHGRFVGGTSSRRRQRRREARSAPSYAGTSFNFDAAPQDLKLAAIEAFAYLELNRLVLRPPPTNVASLLSTAKLRLLSAARTGRIALSLFQRTTTLHEAIRCDDGCSCSPVHFGGAHTFIRGTYFASAVMIGAASEKATYLWRIPWSRH